MATNKTWKNYQDARKIAETVAKYPTIVLYDLETTGFKRKTDKILQFSAIRFSLPEWTVQDSLDIYIKCPFAVNGSQASEVNHITDELLEEKGIEESEAFKKILAFMKPDDCIGGFNNQRFDDEFMKVFDSYYGHTFTFADNVDVYLLAKIIVPAEAVLYPDKNGKLKPSYTLTHITEYFHMEEEIQFHSAIEDVKATGFVCKRLLQELDEKEEEKGKKEEERKEIPRQKVKVLSVWSFHPSDKMKRVYAKTSQGTIYYDCINRLWEAKTGSIDSLDMDDVVNQIFEKLKVDSEAKMFQSAEKADKIYNAKRLLGIHRVTTFDLDQAYNDSINKIDDWDYERRKKEIDSAYRLLRKTLKAG